MTAAYGTVGTVASSGANTVTPGDAVLTGTAIPAGSAGDGWLVPVFWNNSNGGAVIFNSDVWEFLGDSEGGAGTLGTDDQGPRHVSFFWTTQNITGTTQTFTNGGLLNDPVNLIHAYVIKVTKSLSYWAHPEVASASDDVGGAGFAATFNRNPGGTTGDLTVLATIANTDAVNPSGLIMDWAGVTLGTNTAIVTSPFTTGNDSRINLRYRTVTAGTATAPPTVASSTDFTGAALMVRLRDTNTLPVTMSAGVDVLSLEAGSVRTLDSSASVGVTAGRTWSQVAGPTVTLSDVTAISPTFISPPTTSGASLTFRVTDNATGTYDEVTYFVDRSTRRIKEGGVMKPTYRRGVLS